jgi:hypothetical protein
MDVAYPIIHAGMGALRWATGIVRGVDSAAVHVSSTLISPIIGLLPKPDSLLTVEDDPEFTPSSTSLYDEMDSMLDGKLLPSTSAFRLETKPTFLHNPTPIYLLCCTVNNSLRTRLYLCKATKRGKSIQEEISAKV